MRLRAELVRWRSRAARKGPSGSGAPAREVGRALRGALQREKGERGRARLAEENATVCAKEEEPVSVEEGVTVARVPVSPLCVEDLSK